MRARLRRRMSSSDLPENMGPVMISMRPGVGQLVMRQWYWGWWWIFRGYFLGVVEWRFCWGFLKKWGAERGFLLVSLWWIDGESWCVDGRILRGEIFPLFQDLFLGGVLHSIHVDGFFWDVCGAFEVEFVAVGVGEDRDPHVVADEGALGLETMGDCIVVDGEGVFALEADGDAFA